MYLLAMPGSPTADPADPPVLAVVDVAVFDGGGGPPVPGRTVVAAGGVIERVGPAGQTVPPPGAVVVDGAGATLLPGFVDAHVHLDFYPPAQVLARSGPAREALDRLERAGVGGGALNPIEVLVPAGTDRQEAAERLGRLPGVQVAVAPSGPAWQREGTALISVLPVAETSGDAGEATVGRVRDLAAAELPGARVGGSGALAIDATRSLYGSFPLMLAAVAVVTFVLLARAFRSLLLAFKAILLNLLSIGAAYGVLVLVWQEGHGSEAIWGIPATGAIAMWVPLMAFAFLYGLSMDYEVFLLARMREEYDATGSTPTAIVQGLGRVGRLVTSAALILFLAFASMATVPELDVKIMATALGAGILLDATVLRALLVPALVALLGRWNWWLPSWAARALRVPA